MPQKSRKKFTFEKKKEEEEEIKWIWKITSIMLTGLKFFMTSWDSIFKNQIFSLNEHPV